MDDTEVIVISREVLAKIGFQLNGGRYGLLKYVDPELDREPEGWTGNEWVKEGRIQGFMTISQAEGAARMQGWPRRSVVIN